MASYGFVKVEVVEKPKDWNRPGWHEIPGTSFTPFFNPDTGEVVVYVADESGKVLR